LDLSSSPNWVEYARVVSKIVLDAQGTWEFPPNWDQTYQDNKEKTPDQRSDYASPGTFPGFTYEIDPDNSFVDTRVHLIIKINPIGSLMWDDHSNGAVGHDRWFDPYFAFDSYKPKYEIVFADPPNGKRAKSAEDFKYSLNHQSWRNVFLSVDKAEVIADIQADYPGAVEQ
jgi:hypothetical protein